MANHNARVTALAWGPSNKFASTSNDETIYVWDFAKPAVAVKGTSSPTRTAGSGWRGRVINSCRRAWTAWSASGTLEIGGTVCLMKGGGEGEVSASASAASARSGSSRGADLPRGLDEGRASAGHFSK